MATTGAWRRRVQTAAGGDLDTRDWARDPQHRDPDPNYGERNPGWVTRASGLEASPPEWESADVSWTSDAASSRDNSSAFLDRTPRDHAQGLANDSGLPVETSMARNAAQHANDQNATGSRRFARPRDFDGEYHADLVTQPLYNAGRPQDLIFKQQSDPSMSPDARAGNRIERWTDRVYTTMRWGNDDRPLFVTNAYVGDDTPAAKGGPAATSPYSALATVVRRNLPLPQLRRSPPTWDDSQVIDGDDQPTPADSNGFLSWGL